MRRTLPVLTLTLSLLANSALAQAPVGSLTALQRQLQTGMSIVVTDVDGQQIKGRVPTLSADGLEIVVRDVTRRFAQDEIALIEQRRADHVLNGAAIGAGVASGATLALYILVCGGGEDCSGVAKVFGSYAVIGALIGATIDASIRPLRPIFAAGVRDATIKPEWAVSPVIGRGKAGGVVSVRF